MLMLGKEVGEPCIRSHAPTMSTHTLPLLLLPVVPSRSCATLPQRRGAGRVLSSCRSKTYSRKTGGPATALPMAAFCVPREPWSRRRIRPGSAVLTAATGANGGAFLPLQPETPNLGPARVRAGMQDRGLDKEHDTTEQ